VLKWSDLATSHPMFGIDIARNPPHVIGDEAHILAARITSTKDSKDKINAIYVADSDLISDTFFVLRESRAFNLELDNVTFVLNAIDQLAGDTAMVDLRNRRPQPRRLTSVENQVEVFREQSNNEKKIATDDAKKALDDARKRLTEKVKKIQEDSSLDDDARQTQLEIAQSEENRRLKVDEANINQIKEKKLEDIKNQTDRKVREVEASFYRFSLFSSPIPALIFGLIVWIIRKNNEQKDISPNRRVSR
jgi:ABC-2 type transport system permease protein